MHLLRVFGFQINFGPSKTEAMLQNRGDGALTSMQKRLSERGHLIRGQSQEPGAARTFKHVGNVLALIGGMHDDAKHKASSASRAYYPMFRASSTWKCRACSTVNWSTRRTCRHCQSSPERKDNKRDGKKKSQDRDSGKPLAAFEDVTDASRARLVATVRHLSRQLSNESMPEDARSSLAGQEGKGTVRCQTGARQGKVSPGRIEVRSTEAHPRSRRVGGKFRLEGRCRWLAGGWILILALFQQCVLASSHRGRVYVGCSQTGSGDSWLERTGRGAHWYARATAAGCRQHRVDETVAGGSSYACSAEQISGSNTFHPTLDARSRFCVGRPAVGRCWSTGVSVTERSRDVQAGFFLHGGGHASRDVTLFGCHPECTAGDLRLFLGMRLPHDLVDFFIARRV